MQNLLFVIVAALVIGGPVAGWHAQQARERGEEPQTIVDAMVQARRDSVRAMERTRQVRERNRERRRTAAQRSVRPAAVFSFSHLRPQRANGVSDAHRDILMSVSSEHEVPAGILYGIWTNESRRLPGGWSDRWSTARQLVAANSPCRRWLSERGRDPGRCDIWFQSLRRICAQQRPDGTRVCDPDTVRVSVTFDMGPMQHNASTICRRRSGGEYRWGPHIDDYDGDGVFDPHSLEEAMTASASFLRSVFDRCMSSGRQPAIGCWGYAVNEYAGAQSATYYERRIWSYWRQWCSVPGYCE